MKKILLLLLAFSLQQLSFAQPAKIWTEEDRAALQNLLKDSKTKLLDATKGLSDKQINFKPTDTSWSIKGIVEHLADYAESYFWELVSTVRVPLPQFLDSTRCSDQHFLALADNTDKHVATSLFLPRDKYGDFANTLKQFVTFNDVSLNMVTQNKKNLRAYFAVRDGKGVYDCRWRDAHQVVLVEVAHVYRHIKQIERNKAHANYPKE